MGKNKIKRYSTVILATSLLYGVLPNQIFATDITGHWAEPIMKQWESDGLLKGDGSGSLRPDNSITRAEFIALTNRTLGLTKQSDAVKQYEDVEQNAWYYNDVAKALEAGYISGTSQEKMSPLENITNEQVYYIFARIAKENGSMDLSSVVDQEEISSWARQNVEQTIANGYIAGDKGKINPKKETNRAQAVTLLDRFKNEDRVFTFPGTYTAKSARNVTVLSDGIVLKDTVINGDFTLGSEVTEIKVINTQIKGNIIKGSKETKIIEEFLWKDGVFEGVAEGQNGPLRVQVKVEKGKIKDLKILEHKENEKSLEKMKMVLKQIVDTGNLKTVDISSDKTINSNGFFNAVKDAISQSRGATTKPGESKESQEHRKLKDGTYEGIAQGYGGAIRLEIKIKNEKITDIKFLNHNETDAYLQMTERMREKIIEKGNIDKIDTVSGATISSKAILNGIKDAMSQASGRTEKAGETKAAVENYGGGRSGGGNRPTEPEKTDYSKVILPDGDYKGSAIGYGGPISMTVKVENGIISKVMVDSHSETSSYYNRVLGIFDQIVKKNGTNIDTISGATVTSKGILSAVEDALSKVKGKEEKEKKEYADGTWYGQGRGYYPADHYSWGKWKTATEAIVTVVDGKITEAKLEHHGDDTSYVRPEGYKLIEKHIIENNGTEKLPEIFAKRDFNEPIYDAVTGATRSASGFVNAIDHALSRSAKYKKDGITQEIRSISLDEQFLKSVNYGDEVDLSGLAVKVKYTDGREEEIAFADFQEKGITCSLPITFIPKPDNENHYEEIKNFDLTFTHEKSMSKNSFRIQARRKIIYKEISKIEFKTKNGKSYEVPITDTDKFQYSIDLEADQFEEITEVNVFDVDNFPVSVDKYELLTYKMPVLSIELKPLEKPKPEDRIVEIYKMDTFRIQLNINAKFNEDNIISFSINSQPEKNEYVVGENLDLKGLTVTVKDSNYKDKTISLDDLQANGFTVTPESGSVLNEKGTVSVTIRHTNPEIPQDSFDVEVKEEVDLPSKIELQNSDGEVIQTIMLKEGKTVYHGIQVPSKYATETLVVKVYNEEGNELTPYEMSFKPGLGGPLLQIYFTEDDYAFLKIVYNE